MACCPINCAVPRPACAARSTSRRIQHTTWTGQPLDPALAAKLPLFQRLEITVLADLLTGTSVARMPAQTSLFASGDDADCFYVVLEGKVKLFALNEGGEESVVEVFEPVSSFAEAAMFASGSFPLSAEVMEDALLARVPAAPFMRKLRQDHRVAFTMLSNLALWHRRLTREKTSLRVKTPVQRVGGFLLSLTPAESGAVVVTLPFRKSLVASRLGIEPESFSRVMARLRPHGIDMAGMEVRIADVAALRGLCGSF
ncbi:Crp/Fnr family transcriptional regulator [Skermanella aerolata]|uniref:Crp/Fnr family transcriptional regulator n=1 Tax=Skermanella aerolata TaxID=393310 RepID=A0A512DRM4_9PROT|nr:cyclic nucleotide-binding domain-containing protein [Skermanella aerolata]KJB93171.1 Crp/Fnr family transcription regulator [Skermanella aerolata KACC 11604]GEO39124.1 Crp/Fnr family transcriptional regulator [Skermanella aerolata]